MSMSMDFMRLATVVKLVTPIAVVFSVCRGVLGCVHPISTKVCHKGSISLAGIYSPASSALADSDITNFII